MRHIPKMNTKNLGEKRSRHEAQPNGHMNGDETILGKRIAAQAVAMPKKSLLEAADEQ